jgi:hypothetical protein
MYIFLGASNVHHSFLDHLTSINDRLFAATIAFAFGLSFKDVISTMPDDVLDGVFIWKMILGIATLYFVLDDWLTSRRILYALNLPKNAEYTRYDVAFVIVDLIIAVLCFPFLLSGFRTNRISGLLFAAILALGGAWALIALRSNYADGNKDAKRCLLTILSAQGVAVAAILGAYSIGLLALAQSTSGFDINWLFKPFESKVPYLTGMIVLVLIVNRLVGRITIWKTEETVRSS